MTISSLKTKIWPLASKMTKKRVLIILGVIVFALAWYGHTPSPPVEEVLPERIYS